MTDRMQPSASVILDSLSPQGNRLTTMVATMHRFVLAEFNTHRAFSRSSASSRAIPVEKQLSRVAYDPAAPLAWPAEQPGMQGGDELTDKDRQDAINLFEDIHSFTVDAIGLYLAQHPEKATRLHKSLINRLLEPFMWHTVIVTSTEWENFFAQRCSPLAQPEIRATAEAMRAALAASTPQERSDWHIPFIQDDEQHLTEHDKLRIGTARVARVSYLNHDGVRSIDSDLKLFHKLVTADPMHAAPLEMVAYPTEFATAGNLTGWGQLRHSLDLVTQLREIGPVLA